MVFSLMQRFFHEADDVLRRLLFRCSWPTEMKCFMYACAADDLVTVQTIFPRLPAPFRQVLGFDPLTVAMTNDAFSTCRFLVKQASFACLPMERRSQYLKESLVCNQRRLFLDIFESVSAGETADVRPLFYFTAAMPSTQALRTLLDGVRVSRVRFSATDWQQIFEQLLYSKKYAHLAALLKFAPSSADLRTALVLALADYFAYLALARKFSEFVDAIPETNEELVQQALQASALCFLSILAEIQAPTTLLLNLLNVYLSAEPNIHEILSLLPKLIAMPNVVVFDRIYAYWWKASQADSSAEKTRQLLYRQVQAHPNLKLRQAFFSTLRAEEHLDQK